MASQKFNMVDQIRARDRLSAPKRRSPAPAAVPRNIVAQRKANAARRKATAARWGVRLMWTLLISMVVVSAMTVGADLLTYFNSALLIAWMLYRGDRPAPGAKMMQLEGAHREPGGGEVSSKVKAGPSLMEDWHIRNGSVVTESDPEYGLQDNPSIDWYDHMDHYLEDVRRREDDDYYVSRTHNSDY